MSKRSIQYNTESAIINHLNINVDAYFKSYLEGGGHVQSKYTLSRWIWFYLNDQNEHYIYPEDT